MKRSQGHSLVELLVAMSVGTTLLVVGTGVLHRTMRWESKSRLESDVNRTAVRLAHDFRRDVHRAENMSFPGEGNEGTSIRLLLPDEEPATYTMGEKMVLREQQLADGQTRREPYYLPPDYRATFGEVFRPQRAVLTVEHDHGLVGEPPRVLAHVEAEVGRLLRLTTIEEASP